MTDRVIWFTRYNGDLWWSLGAPEIEYGELAGPHTTPRKVKSVREAKQNVARRLPKVKIVGAGICEPGMMGVDEDEI